ncbi:hypothetical protein CH63R_03316 [Colletotrichum higginsianum IMI 349063]|uniref:Uncharacterized protein n=1 Tax=Colletotrichum higginsianum (strain IMI 349063) TaxID=759273 RepID=A0A1B7YRB4_COLHI|nr:hypothetical protein CH63R_03316 [Colletotrichum higginsianum IMI 349063]OBR14590.1 hypothetical protein CH63R_03316 [Colletotrichum higginsianum IMI 349063]
MTNQEERERKIEIPIAPPFFSSHTAWTTPPTTAPPTPQPSTTPGLPSPSPSPSPTQVSRSRLSFMFAPPPPPPPFEHTHTHTPAAHRPHHARPLSLAFTHTPLVSSSTLVSWPFFADVCTYRDTPDHQSSPVQSALARSLTHSPIGPIHTPGQILVLVVLGRGGGGGGGAGTRTERPW